MVFGLFGSVAHELHFCVCAGYRLLICYGVQLLLGCFGSVPPKALDGSFDVGHFMSDFILDVGHVICCCSAVSAADRQRLWKLIQLLIHSVGNVSALFVESCCYSAVVRVGGFLETSSRSVLRLQS